MDKKLLFAMIMSFLTVWGIQYFFRNDTTEKGAIPQSVQPGQSYQVPTQEELQKPLNLEIDFLDKKIKQEEKLVEVESGIWRATFSNFGGVLASLEFKQHKGKNDTPLQTVYKKSFYQREQSCFLVALDEKTPYFYSFESKQDFADKFVITYKVELDGWVIRKVYNLQKNSYRLDLKLEFEKKSSTAGSVKPRLFFNAPFVGEIAKDSMSGFYTDMKGNIQKISSGKELGQAWITPSYFGLENKYFAHSLLDHAGTFVRRAFFKKTANDQLQAILEGPQIDDGKSWKFSFYMGPKSLDDLIEVDEKLEGLLSFGWLSWICKIFVRLLSYLYQVLGNYGLAIILLTILVKIPFIPLSIYSRKQMEMYGKHQPAINRIRMKYKTDMAKQRTELVKYHKDHNLSHATPVMGCLPLLIQIPILFSLYRVLGNYLDLYQAPFFAWIVDLSSKDPYYVLPILMGVSMIWQQKMSPIKDEKQRAMMLFMPLIFMAIFISMPAGLVLYMLVNNLFTVGEDLLRKKILK